MLKRMLSLIVCLALVVGTVPATAFAQETGDAGQAAAQILTAYSAAAITVDGSISEEGWLLIHKVGTVGSFGAQWQRDKLFLAVDAGSAGTLNLTVNGKAFSVALSDLTVTGSLRPDAIAKSGSVVELSIPFAAIGVASDYDVLVPLTVRLDGASCDCTLSLSVVDWFNTENTAHPLTARVVTSAKVAGSSMPTANQGTEKITGGYRFYDLYDAGGNNPVQIRSATIFDNLGAAYMANRGFGLYVEFDFYASCMPVYTAETATDWSPFYGAYGFCWAFADSAPNMLRMGIYNTTEGLVYAVRDGGSKTTNIPLNKKVGDRFRIGAQWQADGDLVITVDGAAVGTVKNASFLRSGIINSGAVFSIIRNGTAAASEKDNIDLTITNIAAGKLVASAEPFIPVKGNATPAEYLTAYTADAVTVDGDLDEGGWLMGGNLRSSDGYIMGTFGAQWSEDALYLAVDPNRSGSVELTVGEKKASVSVEDLTVTGDFTAAVARCDSDDVLEMAIPFTALGMTKPDYNTLIPVKIGLDNGSYTGSLLISSVDWLAAENHQYPVTAYNTTSRKMGNDDPTENQGSEKIDGGYRFFDRFDDGGNNPALVLSSATYSLPNFGARGYGVQLEFDFQAESMPVYTAGQVKNWSRYYAVYGFNACLAEAYVDGQANVVRTGIFNTADGLVFAVKSSAGDVHVPLNKKVGDKFRISLQWQADGDLLIHVDGVLIDTVGSAHVKMGGFMTNALAFNVVRSDAAAAAAADNIDVKVTNVAVGKLSAYAEVYVPTPGDAAPAIIHTAFSEEEILMDGSIAQHGWVMNGRVLNSEGLVTGTFGAQWDEKNLYLAIDPNNAQTVAVTLGEKRFSFNVSDLAVTGDITPAALVRASDNDTLELSVPFESLGISITDYNSLIPVQVTLDEDSYKGNLKLTSVDWFATENELLDLSAGSVGSTALGVGAPTENQGSEALKTGWRMFDLYDPQGNNPEKVRSYVILWRDAVYDPLGDRSRTSYAEFDLKVNSMPVYTAKEAVGWSVREACHGFSWWMADYNNGTRNSNIVSLGVFNTAQGLVLVVLRDGDTPLTFQLGRKVGDQFRLGTAWKTDGSVTVYLDGQEFVTVEGAESNVSSFGSKTLGFNLVRSQTPAACEEDSMDVSVTNIAIGKSYDDSLLDALTWDTIRGENTAMDDVQTALTLPTALSNTQLTQPKDLVWTSSDPETIAADGTVTRPATGFREVTLTATLSDGTTKSFYLVVAGLDNSSGDVLAVTKDYNPAVGAGAPVNGYAFTLDEDNKSIIIDLKEKQPVSVAVLRDGDTAARLNENVLTLWISDDNITYTQIKGFKLLHRGEYWYLYDFAAEGRYVKIHCTHFDGTEADFTGPISRMIEAYDDALLGGGGEFLETAVSVTNTTGIGRFDYAFTLQGIQAQRVLLDGEILYHYVSGDSTVVRIPYLAAGETARLTVLSGNDSALDISNKEYVYEVAYGTREARSVAGEARMVVTLKNGTLVSIGGNGLGTGMSRSFSYDEGRTWTVQEQLDCTLNFIAEPGGFIHDTVTGRIYFQGCWSNGFVAENKEESDGKVGFIYSDDNGVTWQKLGYLEMEHKYGLSYSDGVMLSCYDGMGPNVDFVLNVHVQYNNTGSFCCTVAYTTDAGNSWQVSDSLITFGNEAGYEGGVSEATILERDDGVLVLYARCQFADSDHFAQSYSYDHGITWVEQSKHTQVYTGGTQPIMYRYDEAPVLIWGGNHMQGGTSGIRAPLTMGVSYDGMETFRNLQNLYAKYSLQGLSATMQNRVTNPTAQKAGEDTFISVWWCQGRVNTTLMMRIDDFTDYFYRTKGAYDSFEHGTVRYEGWDTIVGNAEVSGDFASDGSFSMKLSDASAARSVPYIQNGVITMDLYCPDAETKLTVELQSAYTSVFGKGAPVGFVVENNEITFLGAESASGLKLQKGWNSLTITLKLDADTPGAAMSVNGSEAVEMGVNLTIGDYVCYLLISNTGTLYLDNLLVEDDQDALVYHQTDIGAVMRKIAAIGTVTLNSAERIAAAREAYEALTDEQKPLVTNYADLVAAEAALKALQDALPKISGNLSLNETIDINFIIPTSVDMTDAVLVVKNAATGEDVEYTILPGIGGTTVVRYSAKANHMTDEITVQVFDAEGNPLTQMASMSVRKYAGIRLTVAEDTEKMMLIRMLDYGALAQINSGVTTDLANSIVTDELRSFANAYDWADAVALEVPAGSGGVFKAGLALNETIDVTVYTAATNVAEGDKFVVKCNGEELTEDQYIVRLLDDGRYVIRYSVKSNEMSDEIYIAIVGEENTVKAETTLGVRIYAQKFLAAVPTGNQAAMLLAMLDYGALAQIYAGSTGNLANCFVTDTLRQVLISYPWPAN